VLLQEDDPGVLRSLTQFLGDHTVDDATANTIRNAMQRGDRGPFRTKLLELCSHGGFFLMLKTLHFKYGSAARRALKPSMASVKGIVYHAVALNRWVKHGIDGLTDSKLVNEGSDIEYCTIALYGRDYVTQEKKWPVLCEDCRIACDKLWP
jgi:hypothetical protein